MPKSLADSATEVGRLRQSDPAACKKLIVDTLWKCSGSPQRAAIALGVSRDFFNATIRRLGMKQTLRDIRVQFADRFRVK